MLCLQKWGCLSLSGFIVFDENAGGNTGNSKVHEGYQGTVEHLLLIGGCIAYSREEGTISFETFTSFHMTRTIASINQSLVTYRASYWDDSCAICSKMNKKYCKGEG